MDFDIVQLTALHAAAASLQLTIGERFRGEVECARATRRSALAEFYMNRTTVGIRNVFSVISWPTSARWGRNRRHGIYA